MAFSFVAGSSFNTGNVTSETCSVPAGVANGDFLLIAATTFSAGAFTAISGWTTIFLQSAGASASDRFYLAYRVASSEPASYALTCGGSTLWPAGWMIAIRGGATSSPVLGTPALNTNATRQTTLSPPSYSEQLASSLLIYGYGGVNAAGSGSNGLSLPSPGNLLSGSSTGAVSDSSGGADYGMLACTSATGPGNATTTTAVDIVNFVVELAAPASAGPVPYLSQNSGMF